MIVSWRLETTTEEKKDYYDPNTYYNQILFMIEKLSILQLLSLLRIEEYPRSRWQGRYEDAILSCT